MRVSYHFVSMFIDATLKFIFKEIILPDGSDKTVFLIAPIITLALSIAAWAVVPVQAGVVLSNINVGILYIFAISSLGVYGILMAGWSSNSVNTPFLVHFDLLLKWFHMKSQLDL